MKPKWTARAEMNRNWGIYYNGRHVGRFSTGNGPTVSWCMFNTHDVVPPCNGTVRRLVRSVYKVRHFRLFRS